MLLWKCTTVLFKILGLVKFFYVFERSLFCPPKLHLFDLKYNKNSNIVKYYYNLHLLIYVVIYLKYIFLWCIAEFAASFSIKSHDLVWSVSHDPSKIIVICWLDFFLFYKHKCIYSHVWSIFIYLFFIPYLFYFFRFAADISQFMLFVW